MIVHTVMVAIMSNGIMVYTPVNLVIVLAPAVALIVQAVMMSTI